MATIDELKKKDGSAVTMGAMSPQPVARGFTPAGDAASRIPAGVGTYPAPAPDGKDSTELGRNIGNTLSALPGAAPMLGGIRALAGASKVGNALDAVGRTAGAVAAKVAPYAAPVAGFGAIASASRPEVPISSVLTPQPPSTAPTHQTTTVNPATAQAMPGQAAPVGMPGQVTKSMQPNGVSSYSGENVKGDINLPGNRGGMISAQNNQAAENLARAGGQTRGFGPSGAIRGGGQVSSMDTSAGYAADLKQLAEIQAGKDQQNANMQAQADYAQNQVLQQKALQGNPAALALLKGQMTDQTTRRGQDLNAGAMRQTNQLAQDKFGLESQGVNMDNQQKFQMLQIQKAMFDPKATPEQRAEATKQFMALNGKTQASQYDFAPGGQAVIDGQLVTQPGVIFNKATGDAKTPGAQQQKANATSKADYDKLPAGSVYTGQDGKQYKKG